MAGETYVFDWQTGDTLYGLLKNPENEAQIRDVVANAWDAIATDTLADWDIALTEDATDFGQYTFTMPTGVSAALPMTLRVMRQVGGSPSKTADEFIGTMTVGGEAYRTLLRSMQYFKVVNNIGNTDTTFKTDITGIPANHFVGGVCVFATGDNEKQARRITAFNDSTGFITVESAYYYDAFTDDAGVILGRIEV